MSTIIPDTAWQCWDSVNYSLLREFILCFKGDLRKEIAINSFEDVCLLSQGDEGTVSTKGTFYLTSRRIVFLPHQSFPHEQMVQGFYYRFRSISGSVNGLVITITYDLGFVNFRFKDEKSLFQCFNLIRILSEESRQEDNRFARIVANLVTDKKLEETPFTSIEIELNECDKLPEITYEADKEDVNQQDKKENNPTLDAISGIIKYLLDYINHSHFDIHVKLRILFFLSLISFCLNFIPLLPLTGLFITLMLFYNGWIIIDKGPMKKNNLDKNEGFNKLCLFIEEWFQWRDTHKTYTVLMVSMFLFLFWVVLPLNIYILLCLIMFALFIAKPIAKIKILEKISNGFWYCT